MTVRFCVGPGHAGAAGGVALEEGIPDDVIEALRQKGHDVTLLKGYSRSQFGRGQIIREVGRLVSSALALEVFSDMGA